jgi:hypothetical protein
MRPQGCLEEQSSEDGDPMKPEITMQRFLPFLALLAMAACAPSTPPAAAGPDPGGASPSPAGTAPPPAVGAPDWVISQETWANAVCACTDQTCASKAPQPLMMDMSSPPKQEWVSRYTAAGLRGRACVEKGYPH